MHDQEVLIEAIRRRINGVPIKTIAREMRVSVGWASENLSGIRPRVVPSRTLQTATQEEIDVDLKSWGLARSKDWASMNARKQEQRKETVVILRDATGQYSTLPETGSQGYALLDRLQQLLVKNPGGGVFHLVQETAPKLHAHLLGWVQERHSKTQDKSDTRFVEMAVAARDHVARTLSPPSYASQDEEEVAAARWLGRWIANARGRGERKRNLCRAQLMLEIATIVDGLRATEYVLRGPAVKAVKDGNWSRLFDKLIETKNSYAYER